MGRRSRRSVVGKKAEEEEVDGLSESENEGEGEAADSSLGEGNAEGELLGSDEESVSDDLELDGEASDVIEEEEEEGAGQQRLVRRETAALGGGSSGADTEDSEDSEKGEKEGELLTLEMVERWTASVGEIASARSLKRLLHAFSSGACVGEGVAPLAKAELGKGKGKKGKGRRGNEQLQRYRFADAAAYGALMVACVEHMSSWLNAALGRTSASKGLPSSSKKWKQFHALSRQYNADLVRILESSADEELIGSVLRHGAATVPFFATDPPAARALLKVLLKLWGEAENNDLRLSAFEQVKRLAVALPHPFIESCLNTSYLTYVRNTRFYRPSSESVVHLMAEGLVELYCLDLASAYQCAFKHIRGIAVAVREAIVSKSRDAQSKVYSWQCINALRVWKMLVCRVAERGHSELKELVYPLVQVITGVLQAVPSPRYFPSRFHCAEFLIDIARAADVFIPLAPALVEVFQWSVLKQKPKDSVGAKPADVQFSLKLPRSIVDEKRVQDGVVETALSLLRSYLVVYGYSVGFPELTLPVVLHLRRVMKKHRAFRWSGAVLQLIRAVEENSEWVERRRKALDVGPRDVKTLSILRNSSKEPCPLVRLDQQLMRAKIGTRGTQVQSAGTGAVNARNHGKMAEGVAAGKRRRDMRAGEALEERSPKKSKKDVEDVEGKEKTVENVKKRRRTASRRGGGSALKELRKSAPSPDRVEELRLSDSE